MTDEELEAIEARAKGVPYSGISVTPDETLALVAELRRLREEVERRGAQAHAAAVVGQALLEERVPGE